jgi:hypothetical protein
MEMMMNLEMLNKLSTEGLYKLRESVEKVIDSRMDRTPRIGRVGTFTYTRDNSERTVVITKINRTTFSCQETGASVEPGKSWRVGKGALKVAPVERRANQPVRFAQPHRPQTGADAW